MGLEVVGGVVVGVFLLGRLLFVLCLCFGLCCFYCLFCVCRCCVF